MESKNRDDNEQREIVEEDKEAVEQPVESNANDGLVANVEKEEPSNAEQTVAPDTISETK